MYFRISHSFTIFSALSFLPLVIPLATPASRGIAIPIAMRDRDPGPVDPADIVDEVMNSIAKIKRGMDAYEKNTGMAHPLSDNIRKTSAQAKRDRTTSSLPIRNNNRNTWFIEITTGTNSQVFTVIIDTGSGDLIVPLSTCGASCRGHTLYNPLLSDYSITHKVPFKADFHGGTSISGIQYADIVTLAGFIIYLQVFGAATEYPPKLSVQKFPADGILGLAFSPVSYFNALSPIHSIIDDRELVRDMFSLRLSISSHDSELFLGGYNPKYSEADFTWLQLGDKTYWHAYFDKIKVYGHERAADVVGLKRAIFDSGTTFIIGDIPGIRAIYAQFHDCQVVVGHGEVNYYVPCDCHSQIISIFVGGKEIKISSDVFIREPVTIPNHPNYCHAGVVASANLMGGLWILGSVFLMNAYVAFDVENGRIGFATIRP